MTKRGLKIFSIGHKGRDLTLISAEADKGGYQLHLRYADQSMCVHLPLAGDFMISNALVAAGLCITSGADAPKVLAALAHLQGAPGRLEQVGDKAGAPIFVDYAHKPDALDKVLATLRPLASGKLIVVFGCGGDRDQGKRPLMGAIASAQADVVIVTDDNPRSEEPAKIRAAILAQAPGALEIGDRAAAIRHAISLLQKGDVLVIAGKGHETGQIIGTKTMPFSDHDAVHVALAECAA